jgi:hypothetical protein
MDATRFALASHHSNEARQRPRARLTADARGGLRWSLTLGFDNEKRGVRWLVRVSNPDD